MQMSLIGLSGVPRHRQLYKMTEAASRLDFEANLVHLIFSKSTYAHATIRPDCETDKIRIRSQRSPVIFAKPLRLPSWRQVSALFPAMTACQRSNSRVLQMHTLRTRYPNYQGLFQR